MRTLMLVLCSTLSVVCTAMASDAQIARIPARADTLLIVNGQWVPAQDGYYTVVMDSNIIANGVECVPKEQPPVPYEEPSLERCFMDYMARKPREEAQKIIDAGGSYDDALEFMDNFYKQHKSDSLKVELKDGVYNLEYRGQKVGVWVPCQKTEPRVSYREAVLQPRFRELCDALTKGYFMIRCGASVRFVLHEDIPRVIQQLRELPQRAKIRAYMGGTPIYESYEIRGKNMIYQLSPSEVADMLKAWKR